jgi:putative DNA primase/helicase
MINSQLWQEMEAAGTVPAEPLGLLQNGELQRYQVANDKQGTKNGWLVSHINVGSPNVHIFGSWKTGSNHTVVEGGVSNMDQNTRFLIEQAQRQAKLKKEREQLSVAKECARIWGTLLPANDHPYLNAKGIQAHIARRWSESLVIPLVNFNMTMTSLQFIGLTGGKTFRKGGKVNGSFCQLGGAEFANSKTWIVCEGYATGASIHEATGLPVLVAFNANNLKPVATSLRLAAPAAKLIIAADNDRFTSIGNVGVKKAEDAARGASAYVVIPQFETDKGTDFNDLAQQKGLQQITEIFQELVA